MNYIKISVAILPLAISSCAGPANSSPDSFTITKSSVTASKERPDGRRVTGEGRNMEEAFAKMKAAAQ